MNTSSLNALLLQSWPGLRDVIKRFVVEKFRQDAHLAGIQSGGSHFEIKLRFNPGTPRWTGIDQFPPAFVDMPSAFGAIKFAVPENASGWSLTLPGSISIDVLRNGALANHLVQLAQTITLEGFRIEAVIPFSPLAVSPAGGGEAFPQEQILPKLLPVHIFPQFTLKLSGFVNLSLPFTILTQRFDAAGNLFFQIDTRTTPLEGSTNNNHQSFQFEGVIEVHLTPSLAITVKGVVLNPQGAGNVQRFDVDFQVASPLPNVLGRPDLPLLWGDGHKQTIDPVAVRTFDYQALALQLEDRLLHHGPFPPDAHQGDPPYLLALDNRYPDAEIKPCQHQPSEPTTFYGAGDTAIWTGHLLAAEAFRYAAVKATAVASPDDFTAVRRQAERALAGIEKLLEIPARYLPGGRRGLLCRCALPKALAEKTQEFYKDPLTGQETQYPMSGPYPSSDEGFKYYPPVTLSNGEVWYGKGRDADPPSRDSHMGVFLGLVCVYKLMDDAPSASIRQRAGSAIIDMLAYLLDHGWNLPTPSGALTPGQTATSFRTITTWFPLFHQQLALLAAGRMVEEANPQGRFTQAYDHAVAAAQFYPWLPVWANLADPVHSYFKFNLDMDALALLLWLDDTPTNNALPRLPYLRAMEMLYENVLSSHRNPYFHLLWLLAHRPGERKPLLSGPAPGSAFASGVTPAATLRDEIHHLLFEWQIRLKKGDAAHPSGIAGPNCLPLTLSPDQAALTALYPASAAIFPKGATSGDILSTTALRCDVRTGRDMDFMWQRDPFTTNLSKDKNGVIHTTAEDTRGGVKEGTGIDYLLASWMTDYLQMF